MKSVAWARWKKDISETVVLAAPVILGQISYMVQQSTDVALVGRYSSSELSGLSIGFSISMVGFLVVLGLMTGVSVQVAEATGAGRDHECGKSLRTALWVALTGALLWWAVMQFAEPILLATGQPPALAAVSGRFLQAFSLGYPPSFAFLAYKNFVEGTGATRPPMVAAISMMLLNFGVCRWLVYGGLGIPAMGAVGSGLATALVSWLGLLGFALYVHHSPRFSGRGLHLLRSPPTWQELRSYLKLSFPVGVSLGMEVGLFSGVALMMGWFGETAVAAHQVVMSVISSTFMVPLGVAAAGCIRVGQARGRQDLQAVRQAGFSTLLLAALAMVLSALLLSSVPELLLGIYTVDPEVVKLGTVLLMLAAATQVVDGLQVAGSSVLRGLEDTRIPMLATILAYWAIALPVAYVLAIRLKLGPEGLWYGIGVGLAVAALCHVLRFRWWLKALAAGRVVA